MKRIPKLCHHKGTGRGYSNDPFTQKEVYHGTWGSPECQAAYEAWLQALLTRRAEVKSGAPSGSSVSVSRLIGDYLAFAKGYYQKHGERTSEYSLLKMIATDALGLFKDLQADAFGPSQLKAVRQLLLERGNARQTINRQVQRLVRIWRWGVEQEIVRPMTLVALDAVRGLSKGRTKARETDPVAEVPLEVFWQTVAHLNPMTKAMVLVHLWGSMRAEEVVALRGQDIDTSDQPWLYVPWSHKTEHTSRQRRIWLGPQCQSLLGPVLAKRRPSEWLFRGNGRDTPLTVGGYRARIVACCEKHGIPQWCPRQLRHTALTIVRQKYGLEGAQRAGGHASADVTQIYTERDEALARRIASDLG